MLHGCTQDPRDLAKGTRVTAHGDRAGALVLLPEQPDSANPRKCWNWFDPSHQLRDRGEPAIIAAMTRQIMRDYAVDERRVYIAGVSAGAAMASLAAVAYPELFAAVGLHSGIPYRGAATAAEALAVMANGVTDVERLAVLARGEMGERARPIPAIVFQGGSDPIVRPVNARQSVEQWLGMNDLAARRKPAPGGSREARREEGSAQGYAFTRDCYPGYAGFPDADRCVVESWTVAELGHAWSGGSREGTFTDDRGPDATAEMFRFFAEHRWAPVPNVPPGQ
jgi:poly(hydroxyalkanoate) depolymerase family esterase